MATFYGGSQIARFFEVDFFQNSSRNGEQVIYTCPEGRYAFVQVQSAAYKSDTLASNVDNDLYMRNAGYINSIAYQEGLTAANGGDGIKFFNFGVDLLDYTVSRGSFEAEYIAFLHPPEFYTDADSRWLNNPGSLGQGGGAGAKGSGACLYNGGDIKVIWSNLDGSGRYNSIRLFVYEYIIP